MGLDNDLYTCLSTDWDTAIIAKPTFHKNEQNPNPQVRHLFIQARNAGNFIADSSDSSLDMKEQLFQITSYEGLEADVEKIIKAVKKALHSKAVTNGMYRIENFEIIEDMQLVTVILQGKLLKYIGVSDF